ncbi:MAG: flagellar motor switch protein FliN [Novosphingobium sp.]
MNLPSPGLSLFGDVTVSVSVELGRTQMPLRDVLALGADSIVALDRLTDELLDVLVNGTPIARAEIVTQDNRFALKIVELVGQAAPSTIPSPIQQPAHPGEVA